MSSVPEQWREMARPDRSRSDTNQERAWKTADGSGRQEDWDAKPNI
jgi:hypothetical protein